MKPFFGLLLTFFVVVALADLRVFAQVQPARPQTPDTQVVRPPFLEVDANQTRDQLREVLQRYPPDIGRILKMDPTMMLDQAYISKYPALAQFLAAHPEVVRNPGYYFEFVRLTSDYTRPEDPRSRAIDMWRNQMEAMSVFVVMVFIGSMFAWLVRTALDHRRWVHVSRVQNEVHNKLLDRFAGTSDLLAYVQSPAGRRFLEAAPIPVDTSSGRAVSAPLSRILWSVQAGVVLAVGGIGFQFASGRVIAEVAEGLWMIGVLAVAFGVGFILSGLISYVLSRRLGLLDHEPILPPAPRGDTTAV